MSRFKMTMLSGAIALAAMTAPAMAQTVNQNNVTPDATNLDPNRVGQVPGGGDCNGLAAGTSNCADTGTQGMSTNNLNSDTSSVGGGSTLNSSGGGGLNGAAGAQGNDNGLGSSSGLNNSSGSSGGVSTGGGTSATSSSGGLN